MELALAHIVVRVCGPGIGPDLVAALSTHPVETSEARDAGDMHRLKDGRPAILVVLVDPPDAARIVSDTWLDFPGVPILIISDVDEPFPLGQFDRGGWVDTVRSSQPLQDLCWHVLAAAGRAAHVTGIAERPLAFHMVEVDPQGRVVGTPAGHDLVTDAGFRLRPGDSLLSALDPLERAGVARMLDGASAGGAVFCATRLHDDHGKSHIVALGMRELAAGRIGVLVQPLICGGPIVGRHINNRDPITGLLTRWAISRVLQAATLMGPSKSGRAVVVITLDGFDAISNYIGHQRTDEVLVAVASVLHQVFPHPAVISRVMGDTFFVYLPQIGSDEARSLAGRFLAGVGGILVPGFAADVSLRASIGVAPLTDSDHDLALRLAEAAVAEARAAGGNRVVISGSAEFTTPQTRKLISHMELGSWEAWLQPVVGPAGGPAAHYHEALARFDGVPRHMASRADFFTAGEAHGLLKQFDHMMLQRILALLESHPHATLAMNVSYETFISQDFPGSWLDGIQPLPGTGQRLILEIAPRCLAAEEELVRHRLESLAAAGVAVAIDDFGSGICRLRYLTQWPLGYVKLDQLVTGYVDDDPLQREFVRTVVALCRARGILTVAEYTRSPEQLARLVADGVDLFQGELFGMPRPAAEVLARPCAPEARHAADSGR